MTSQMLWELQTFLAFIHVSVACDGIPQTWEIPFAKRVGHRNEAILLNLVCDKPMADLRLSPFKVCLCSTTLNSEGSKALYDSGQAHRK